MLHLGNIQFAPGGADDTVLADQASQQSLHIVANLLQVSPHACLSELPHHESPPSCTCTRAQVQLWTGLGLCQGCLQARSCQNLPQHHMSPASRNMAGHMSQQRTPTVWRRPSLLQFAKAPGRCYFHCHAQSDRQQNLALKPSLNLMLPR